jgi:hypothetical protein
MKHVFIFSLTMFSLTLLGQGREGQVPDIDCIMQGEDFVGVLPQNHYWSEDGLSILFTWNPDGDTIASTYGADPMTGQVHRLTVDELKALPGRGSYNRDYSLMVYEKHGDLFLLDLQHMESSQVTATLERESSPVISGDGKSVVYRKGDNLFRWCMEAGSVTQITNFQEGSKRKTAPSNDKAQWLEDDQLRLSGVLSDQEDRESARESRSELLKPRRPAEIWLEKKRLGRMNISPDLRYVVYSLTIRAERESTMVADFVTSSGYVEERTGRSKVGGMQDRYETWVFDTKKDTAYQVLTEDVEGIRDKPVFLKEGKPAMKIPGMYI